MNGCPEQRNVHDDPDDHADGDGGTEQGEAGAEVLCGVHLEEGVVSTRWKSKRETEKVKRQNSQVPNLDKNNLCDFLTQLNSSLKLNFFSGLGTSTLRKKKTRLAKKKSPMLVMPKGRRKSLGVLSRLVKQSVLLV